MNYMRISSVKGLFHEFYKPVLKGLFTKKLEINENELDATDFFWSMIFDVENIKQVINKIVPSSIKSFAIVANVELFIKQVEKAKKNICNPEITSQEFFCYLETLSIICDLYSKYIFLPHRLNIQNGFETDCSSAFQVYRNCLRDNKNPYLHFIVNYIMPHIRATVPTIIFIDGMPTLYNMTVCRLVKNEFPQIHISLSRHSSEYYSLNKLETHLVENKYLFKMVDSIILEFFEETERKLINTLKNGGAFSEISNLVYKNNEKIYMTLYKKTNPKDYIPEIQAQYSTRRIINVHLQPYSMCYWNKCTFCGINKKYHFKNNETNKHIIEISLKDLKKRIDKDTKYIWFIDEAIHPIKLKYIANFFIKNKFNFFWQARCRIEKMLLDKELITLLQKAGLKELRLGLESASINVLKLMNKFDDDFSLELVDKICKEYTSVGISIHFPIIIGFPGESLFDRKKTYRYLQCLCQKYHLVSFNINIFNLDISSYVFKNPDKYGIEKIYYPYPMNDFLGNVLQWERGDNTQKSQLVKERDQYMKEILYPWMPINSFIKPYLFYRLSETIRNTLIWKCQKNKTIFNFKKSLTSHEKIIISDTLVYSFDSNRNVYIIYNWSTHHYMIGNEHLIFIFRLFRKAYTIPQSINKLVSCNSAIYTSDDLKILLFKLYQQGYLIKIKEKGDGHEY